MKQLLSFEIKKRPHLLPSKPCQQQKTATLFVFHEVIPLFLPKYSSVARFTSGHR